MFIKSIILVVLFFYPSQEICLKKVSCPTTDVECTTETAKHLTKFIVSGNPTYNIESLDPMYQDVINADLPNTTYILRNASMHGFKDCEVRLLRFNPDNSVNCYILCPRLIVEGDYELNCHFASTHVEGNGKCKIVQGDYHIGIEGHIETVLDSDGNPHIHIKKYEIDLLDVRGNIVYEFQNLFYGDEEKSKKIHTYINENWKRVSAVTQYPAIYSFMGKFVESVNKFLSIIPNFDIFYKYV